MDKQAKVQKLVSYINNAKDHDPAFDTRLLLETNEVDLIVEALENLLPKPIKYDLRVWWVPNPPRPCFYRTVKTVEEAMEVLDLLADYDNYLGDPLIETNMGGLQIKDKAGDWVEWHNTDDDCIDDVRHKEEGEELNLITHEDY